jgi:hypothetical protein
VRVDHTDQSGPSAGLSLLVGIALYAAAKVA